MDQITAILALFDDQDPLVQDSLATRLGADQDLLDRIWDAAVQRGEPAPGLVGLVLRADAEALVDAFAEADDLEAGVWLLPRLHLPRRDYPGPGTAALDALAARVPAGADGGGIAAFLCQDCGFVGDHEDYENPLNSFMPWVLERRLGLPIALTTLWILVGRRLGVELDLI